MIQLCPPAIIYLLFSTTQIIIDLFKGLRNTALMKTVVAIMVTLLLNILCERGLNIISWIIVFIPFILMTVVVSMLLYIFGLDAATGKLNKTNYNSNITTDKYGNIIIYDPNYNNLKPPLYYKYPNLIVTNPENNTNTNTNTNTIAMIPTGSSSKAYQS
jgi:hypothetical protein